MPANSIIKRVLVKKVISETDSAKSYVLEPLDGWNPEYVSGQFITLLFHTKHGEKRRSYSFSSSPETGEEMKITVKHVTNGEFSRWMLAHIKEGDVFQSSGIGGFFTLPKQSIQTKNFCFLAAGSGITPCISLIKILLMKTNSTITLIYSNPSEHQTIFYHELIELQKKHEKRFQTQFLFSNSRDIITKRLSRWLLDQLIPKYLGAKAGDTEYYLCGPFEYMQMAEITLRMYAPAENIHKENFSNLPRLIKPEPPDKEKHKVRVEINGSSYHLDVQYPDTVLAAAKQKGIELPYSCEAGRCGSCIASCSSGKMWMAYNEVLTDKEVDAGRVLVCQAYPVGGDVTVTYDKDL